MSSDVVIRLTGVQKWYPVFERPHQALVHALVPSLEVGERFVALRDIDLEIRRGESIGVIGRNGSGKSTLLQVIAGILQPSAGRVEVTARIAALLELGAGFNPEFTGRENIHLNASLLGLSAAQIAARLDQILAFAEIGEHLEQPVKTYSSGMFLRLAFAVAVHTDPDVLIVDEALSVGDVYFQRKCFRRIEQMREAGCTLLFVTHSVDSVLQLCDRGIVLEGGRLIHDGEARGAVKAYLRTVFGDNTPAAGDAGATRAIREAREGGGAAGPAGDDGASIEAFRSAGATDMLHRRPGYNRDETRLGDGRATTCDALVLSRFGEGPLVPAREPFRILVRYALPQALDRLIFGLRICLVTGQVVYSANTLVSQGHLYACDAGTIVIGEFDLRCSLLAGQYFVTVGVSRRDEETHEVHALDRRSDALILTVSGPSTHAEGLVDMEAGFAMSGLHGALRAQR